MIPSTHILLTEDEEINQEIFLELLDGSGIMVDVATNGREAVEKSQQKQYALIVMDIEMPIMNGYESTKEIRNFNKSIPIIALTSNNTIQDILKTKAYGMNEHLAKPATRSLLYQTLSKYIRMKEFT